MNLFTEIKLTAYNLKAEMPMPKCKIREQSTTITTDKKTLKDLPLFFLTSRDTFCGTRVSVPLLQYVA